MGCGEGTSGAACCSVWRRLGSAVAIMRKRGRRAELAGLLAIVLVAAWLRLGWPGVSSFGYDEARVSRLALDMARRGQFAVLGMPSSTGIPNFPAAVWLYSLPYSISTNPQAAIAFTALVNVLAVIGVWWLARQAWGAWSGLGAAALFATSPFAVFYARGIWGQDWLAPGAVLWAVCAVQGIRRKSGRWLGTCAFLAGFLGQVHPAGFVLALATIWIVFRFRLWRRWTALLVGGGLALLAALPAVVHIVYGAAGVRADLARLLARKAIWDWTSVKQLLDLGTSRGWEWFWLGPAWRWDEPLGTPLWLSRWALGGMMLSGALGLAAGGLSGRGKASRGALTARRVLAGVLLPWVLAAPLLFLAPRSPAYIQYQLTAFPALLLLAAAAVRQGRRSPRRYLWMAVLAGVAVVQAAAVAQTLSTVRDRYVPGGLGTPMLYLQDAVGVLKADSPRIVVETAGGDPAFDGDAAALDVLLWDVPHQLVDARSALILPSRRANLLFTFGDLPAWEVASYVGLEGEDRELPRRGGEPPYQMLAVEPPYDLVLTPLAPAALANGAELVSWGVQMLSDGRIRLITAWRVAGAADGRFHQFNHLYLEGTEGPAVVHDVYAQSEAWREQDLLITWAEFEMPSATALRFEVGMYRYPEVERVPGADPDDPSGTIRLEWRGR